MMETHIVCDFARAKGWWCEKQFAKCPHRERWYPQPWFPGCADCIKKKEQERKKRRRRARVISSRMNPGDAGGSGRNGENGGHDEEELEDELAWCSGFGMGGEEKKEAAPALISDPGPALRERSDSVRTTRTTWRAVQTAARAGEPEPRLWPAEDALKDARAGVPKPRKKRWYKPSH